MATPSSPIRFCFPIDTALSLRITLLARRAERTRGWIARSLLTECVTAAMQRYADLEGVTVAEWEKTEREQLDVELREAIGGSRLRLLLSKTEAPAINPGEVD